MYHTLYYISFRISELFHNRLHVVMSACGGAMEPSTDSKDEIEESYGELDGVEYDVDFVMK